MVPCAAAFLSVCGDRHGTASENVQVSDEVFVTALERHRDAVDAKFATGLLAWAAYIGAAEACRLLIELGADVSLRPARMLGRNALHVAASRSWRGAYDAIAAAAGIQILVTGRASVCTCGAVDASARPRSDRGARVAPEG